MNLIDQLSTEHEDEYEFEYEMDELGELESPFSEEEELEFAYELLEISSDEELDYFLGKLFKRAWRGLKKIGSKVGRVIRPLGRILKPLAKRLLPVAAGAAGTFFGGPAGGAIASKLGSMVSSALEMELEGMPEEDKELEVARRFVRLAGSAARQAARVADRTNAASAAQRAVMSALRRHVPGVTGMRTTPGQAYPMATVGGGRWVRRGNRIVLLGV